ncbi:hypothetical protein [Undibacterium oligocarboniphilum]|uniref:Uncharacterized protein n=1 Tax=Undibacterium oligocarboniphilum TaxID=666702 RepID=A0A850QNK1_9BURK|nr:hypothetical protein [Undibacterium oligocarboniphilum]MBC3871471.1 hypothetical protein [Undibacterium oligocarboniphilum]NVO78953.1 hypothetical protein [Undibacterium oligocarboniphilum]
MYNTAANVSGAGQPEYFIQYLLLGLICLILLVLIVKPKKSHRNETTKEDTEQ